MALDLCAPVIDLPDHGLLRGLPSFLKWSSARRAPVRWRRGIRSSSSSWPWPPSPALRSGRGEESTRSGKAAGSSTSLGSRPRSRRPCGATMIWWTSAPALECVCGACSPASSLKEYYDELIQSKKQDGVRVDYNGKHGKGVFASKEFDEGDLILKDQILVGAQHSILKNATAANHVLILIGKPTILCSVLAPTLNHSSRHSEEPYCRNQ